MRRIIIVLSRIVVACYFLQVGIPASSIPEPAKTWYKGNLHTHTTFSDGDTDPEEVINWYKEHGYDFLALSDHNHITPPADYRKLWGDDFLLISANEISDKLGTTPFHFLALNVHDPELVPAGGTTATEVMQNNIRAIRAAGGVPVLAHPNFKWAFQDKEMLQVEGCNLFEVWNAHPSVNNLGGGGYPGTEQIWDRVLSAGGNFFGIGTDDMHKIASYPGKSWVMVHASELSVQAILQSLEAGDFYVSTGVELEDIQITTDRIHFRILESGRTKFRTRFIGRNGIIRKLDESTSPSYHFTGKEGYIRAKVIDSNGRIAFTQPVRTGPVALQQP